MKIDIQNFNETAQSQSPSETVEYIKAFYQFAEESCAKYQWRIVKAMGDCILIVAEGADTVELKAFFKTVQEEYSISCQYRDCEYAELDVSFGKYQCSDIFGKDINNLFYHDDQTVLLG